MSMDNSAYYTTHDSNARNDPAIIRLRLAHGWAGYGIYWAVIEVLREQDGYRLSDGPETIGIISMASGVSEAELIPVLASMRALDLVNSAGGYLVSQSLCRRMRARDVAVAKARKAADFRWNKQHNPVDASASPKHMLQQGTKHMRKQCQDRIGEDRIGEDRNNRPAGATSAPYEIPKPRKNSKPTDQPAEYVLKTPQDRIMAQYKELCGLDYKDRAWDKHNRSRYGRSCSKLLEAFGGDGNAAVDWLLEYGKRREAGGMAAGSGWTLDAAAKVAWDDPEVAQHRRNNGIKNATVGLDDSEMGAGQEAESGAGEEAPQDRE
jgi:hypothetical protein